MCILILLKGSAFPCTGGEAVFPRAVCTPGQILSVDTVDLGAVSLFLSLANQRFGLADTNFSARR